MADPNPRPEGDATVAAHTPSLPPVTGTGADTLGGGPAQPHAAPRFGEFVLAGELGRGGMGVVYRAQDPNLKREVALKVMLPQFAANPDAKARFVREARAQAKVEHDHVAAIFQVAEYSGVPYLVMPLLRGMTLQAALKANPRPPLPEVIRIGREVAEGLAAAHEKGLVHRDIKPANVWLEGKKLRVKVLDFGLARVADTESTDTDGPLTAEGAIVGTPAYMSPEQAQGRPVDGRTDLFSLGVMLYQMAVGELPFRGPSTLAVLSALALHTPPPLIEMNPAVPPALSHLVERLLAKRADGRPPTAEAVADELRAVEAGLANAVRVIPLGDVPPIVVWEGPAGPDPFADLDATEANSAPDAERIGPAEPVSTRAPAKPRGGLPTWAVVAGVLLAVAGVVGIVASQAGKKPEPEVAKDEQPTPAKKDVAKKEVPPADPERAAAVLFNPYAVLALQVGTEPKLLYVSCGRPLPDEPFVLVDINMDQHIPAPPAAFAEKALAALPRLGSLACFVDTAGRLRWSAEHLAQLAGSRAGQTLVWLRVNVDPSPKAWQALKQVPLRDLGLFVGAATDDSVAELPPLGAFDRVDVTDLGKSERLTATGWGKLLNFARVGHLTLNAPRGVDAGVGKVIAGIPGLESLAIVDGTLDAAAVQELSKSPNLTSLGLTRGTVPDAGYRHLAGFKSLTRLSVDRIALTPEKFDALLALAQLRHLELVETGVTPEQLKRLNAALPRCTITGTPQGPIEPSDSEYRVVARAHTAGGGVAVTVKLPDGTEVLPPSWEGIPPGSFVVHRIRKPGREPCGNDDLKRWGDVSSLAALDVPHHQIDDAGLTPLLKFKGTLTELDLADGPVTDEGLKTVGQLTALTRLGLDQTGSTDAGLAQLRGLAGLQSLALRDTAVTDAGLKHLAGFGKLSHLSLAGTAVSDAGVKTLAGMKGLARLDVTGTRVSEAGRKDLQAALPGCKVEWEEPNRALAKWPLLYGPATELRLELPDGKEFCPTRPEELPAGPFTVSGIHRGNGVKPPFGDAAFRRLGTIDNLKTLSLHLGHKVSTDGLQSLLSNKNTLTSLYLSDGSGVTDEGLKLIGQMSKLRVLLVNHSKITDAGLAALAGLEKIHMLELAEVPITGAGLKHIAAMKTIERLFLPSTSVSDTGLEHLVQLKLLYDLNLQNTRVTDAGLKHLLELKKLTTLSLGDTAVSGAGAEQLATMKSLQFLDLRATRVTEAEVMKLRAALPKCKVEWSPRAAGLRFDAASPVAFPDFKTDLSRPVTLEGYITPAAEQGPGNASCVFFMDLLNLGWADGKWHMRVWGKGGVTHPATVGRRTHVAGVFESNAVRLYVDGKLIGSQALNLDAAFLREQHPFQLGWSFPGVMEEVRVSKVARYDKDFTPAARFTPDQDTLALYHLDDGNPEGRVRDASGNGRHGACNPANWVWDRPDAADPKKKP